RIHGRQWVPEVRAPLSVSKPRHPDHLLHTVQPHPPERTRRGTTGTAERRSRAVPDPPTDGRDLQRRLRRNELADYARRNRRTFDLTRRAAATPSAVRSGA